ncbi:PH domain-containing protein [Fictibacillus aquaticus]|uniref:Uncharacterized protein YyaB-like PH domain-containing protein n=1 Tax=Fictibacillus aquaticus TaxID=2021314 RepID=A0A235F5V4_9BACL|nr:PH domain-containing protein [Fictibacillus aquaticus]OYD56612.1 hypothetical protein CGZ90_16505 [Fictibacillus aquaticus]
MTFTAERDRFFVILMFVTLFVVGCSLFIPLWFDKENLTAENLTAVSSLYIFTMGVILWVSFFFKYTLHNEYLLVKGGPAKSRILYSDITKVAPVDNIYTGFRMHSSRNSIEVFYKTGWTGSVKISPKNQKLFIDELKKRCPNAVFDSRL